MQEFSYGELCAIFYDATKKFAPQAELDFYTNFMQPNGKILEAMAGSGRLQIPLMQLGYSVDGVDSSAVMLRRCLERAAKLGLTPNVYQQLLQELDLPFQYQTAVIAVGSFQLITERKAALKALQKIRAHLLEDGNLLFSIFDPTLNFEEWSRREVRLGNNNTIKLTVHREINKNARLASAYCNYELLAARTCVQREEELIEVTWYSMAELQDLLDTAGFRLVQVYDYFLPNEDGSKVVHAKPKNILLKKWSKSPNK